MPHMYYQRDPFGDSAGSILVLLVEIALVLIVIGIFLIVATVVFVVTTFVEHGKHKSLWIALAVCAVLCVAGGLLYSVYQPCLALVFVGIAELLITCLVVKLKNRDTLMRENINLIDEVLHTPWWGSEDKPRQEKNYEPIAA